MSLSIYKCLNVNFKAFSETQKKNLKKKNWGEGRGGGNNNNNNDNGFKLKVSKFN